MTDHNKIEPTFNAPVVFNGEGRAYFKIWASNILFMVLTFGLYAPWAKVKTLQYFYANTQIQSHRFRFLADPKQIFKSRIIALLAFVAYSVISEIVPVAGGILALGFMFLIPWIINAAIRFKSKNTSFRGVRFKFTGSYKESFKCFLAYPFLNILTLGLLTPWVAKKTHVYLNNHYYYGQTNFLFDAATSLYYKRFASVSLSMVIGGLISLVLGFFIHPGVGMFTLFLALLVCISLYKLQILELAINNTSFENKKLKATYSIAEFVKIKVSNTLLTVITLGIYYPWAKVRLTAFYLNPIYLYGTGDLDSFTAAEMEKSKALGEEMSDVFDVDVGLI